MEYVIKRAEKINHKSYEIDVIDGAKFFVFVINAAPNHQHTQLNICNKKTHTDVVRVF